MIEDIMVDLETMDKRSRSAIISIGAVRIDWNNSKVVDPFYRVVNLQSCLDIGLTESAETRAWWAKQSDEAKAAVFKAPNIPIIQALQDFGAYLRVFGEDKVRIWGNGSDFDNVILMNAYDALGFEAPWRFYNNRCFRTIKEVHKSHIKKPERVGVHHNALDDAIYQAEILVQLKKFVHPHKQRKFGAWEFGNKEGSA